jgi:hypothetical protein
MPQLPYLILEFLVAFIENLEPIFLTFGWVPVDVEEFPELDVFQIDWDG